MNDIPPHRVSGPGSLLGGAGLPHSALLISGLLWMASCGPTTTGPGGEGESRGDGAVTVATGAVDPPSPQLRSIGEQVTLVATAFDSKGSPVPDRSFTWASTREDVATVGPDGGVTAVADGVAEIRVTTDGITGQALVEVSQRATQVVFTRQPPPALVAGEALGSGVVVEVRDAGGTVVAGWSDTIVTTLLAGPPEATLVGDTALAPVEGTATFDLVLEQPGEGYVLGVRSGDLEVGESEPFDVWGHAIHVDSITLSQDTLAIGGGLRPYTVWLTNLGDPVGRSGVQTYIEQSGEAVPAGGRAASCGDEPLGTLPTGSCSFSFTLAAQEGVGLVPGRAEAIFEVFGGEGEPFVHVVTIPIVLIEYVPPEPPAVSLGEVTLDQTVLVINGAAVSYKATIVNDEVEDVTNISIQGWVEQGAASRAAGGSSARCGLESGTVPPGQCLHSFTAAASNTFGGTGTLVPGDAVLRLELYVYIDGVKLDLDEVSTPVTLVD